MFLPLEIFWINMFWVFFWVKIDEKNTKKTQFQPFSQTLWFIDLYNLLAQDVDCRDMKHLKIHHKQQKYSRLNVLFHLQERRQQQTDKDLPSGGKVRLLRPSDLQLGGGAHQPLSPRVARPVQPQTGRQAALPGLQTPAGLHAVRCALIGCVGLSTHLIGHVVVVVFRIRWWRRIASKPWGRSSTSTTCSTRRRTESTTGCTRSTPGPHRYAAVLH